MVFDFPSSFLGLERRGVVLPSSGLVSWAAALAAISAAAFFFSFCRWRRRCALVSCPLPGFRADPSLVDPILDTSSPVPVVAATLGGGAFFCSALCLVAGSVEALLFRYARHTSLWMPPAFCVLSSFGLDFFRSGLLFWLFPRLVVSSSFALFCGGMVGSSGSPVSFENLTDRSPVSVDGESLDLVVRLVDELFDAFPLVNFRFFLFLAAASMRVRIRRIWPWRVLRRVELLSELTSRSLPMIACTAAVVAWVLELSSFASSCASKPSRTVAHRRSRKCSMTIADITSISFSQAGWRICSKSVVLAWMQSFWQPTRRFGSTGIAQ